MMVSIVSTCFVSLATSSPALFYLLPADVNGRDEPGKSAHAGPSAEILNARALGTGQASSTNRNGSKMPAIRRRNASDVSSGSDRRAKRSNAGTGRHPGVALGEQIVFCQEPDQGTHGGYAFSHSDADYGTQAADSFSSVGATSVERIRWWGAYQMAGFPGVECDPIPADDFTLTFYIDSGGVPGTPVSTNVLGASASRALTGATITYGGDFDEYVYTADLVEPFVAAPGATYWVEIVSNAVDACAWSWEIAPPGTDGDGSALWDQFGSGYVQHNFDLAFCLLPPSSFLLPPSSFLLPSRF